MSQKEEIRLRRNIDLKSCEKKLSSRTPGNEQPSVGKVCQRPELTRPVVKGRRSAKTRA